MFIFGSTNQNTIELIKKNMPSQKMTNEIKLSSLPKCLIINSFLTNHQYLNSTLHYFWSHSCMDITIMTYDQKGQTPPFLSQVFPSNKSYTVQLVSPESRWFIKHIRDWHGYEKNLKFLIIPYIVEQKLKIKKKSPKFSQKR